MITQKIITIQIVLKRPYYSNYYFLSLPSRFKKYSKFPYIFPLLSQGKEL